MSNESSQHKQLKILGRMLLSNMGFPSTQIYEEQTVSCNGHNYRADLIGVPYRLDEYSTIDRDGLKYSVIIECGNSSPDKFKNLRDTGAILLHLPYTEFKDKLLVSKEAEEYLRIIAQGMKGQRLNMSKLIMNYEKDLKDLHSTHGNLLNDLEEKKTCLISDLQHHEDRLKELSKKVEDGINALQTRVDSVIDFRNAIKDFLFNTQGWELGSYDIDRLKSIEVKAQESSDLHRKYNEGHIENVYQNRLSSYHLPKIKGSNGDKKNKP